MNTTHLKTVRRLFINDLTPIQVQRHNMRAWVKSVRHLGDGWLLKRKVGRVYDVA